MASFSTTVGKIGVNGAKLVVSGGLTSISTATTYVALTVGDLANVALFAYNPTGATDITVSVSTTGASSRYASQGRGTLVLTTALGSSDYMFFGNLESAWFNSTSRTVVITATTTILIGAIEMSSTRSN